MTDQRLLRVQAYSGATFLLFLVVHLATLGMAPFGVAAFDAFQRSARSVYQFPVIEGLLVAAPLVVHAGAAIARLWRSGFRRKNKRLRARLHRATGYFLLLAVGGHVLATRGPSLFLGFHPEFAGLAFSLWWQPWVFYPYYALLSLSGLYHGLNGLLLALSIEGRSLPSALREGPGFWVPTGLIAALLLAGVLALGGQLYEIADPRDNDYARMWEGFGAIDLSR